MLLNRWTKENKHLFEDLFVLSGGNGEYLYNKFLHIKNHPNETEKTLDELKQHINFWKEISNNNYFIELQRDGTPLKMIILSLFYLLLLN